MAEITQGFLRELIDGILDSYPKIESMDTTEDFQKAEMRLVLNNEGVLKSKTYHFSNKPTGYEYKLQKGDRIFMPNGKIIDG